MRVIAWAQRIRLALDKPADYFVMTGDQPLGQKVYYYKGARLIATLSQSAKGIFNSMLLTVVSFDETTVTLEDEEGGAQFTLPKECVRTHTRSQLCICMTLSSSQGRTLGKTLGIWDAGKTHTPGGP